MSAIDPYDEVGEESSVLPVDFRLTEVSQQR